MAEPLAATARFIPVAPFDLVVIGATGDLTLRKLMPALFHRFADGQIPRDSRIIAAARAELTSADYRAEARRAHDRFHAGEAVGAHWDEFAKLLSYQQLDALSETGWDALAATLSRGPARTRVFYLATSPELYVPIAQRIAAAGLAEEARVVLEKPIGHDLASAVAINEGVGQVFDERQIFRIDHYLGKETVQNLLVLRFANSILEPLWGRQAIDHVQISVAEDLGVAGRGAYYDRAGAVRDMVQNHLLQLLCLVAMEPPRSLDGDDVRDCKLQVLRALKLYDRETIRQATVRGQYAPGHDNGKAVPGYREEVGETGAASRTETFVALKAEVGNWRWAGVPFYLRTGKRMGLRRSDIVITFKPTPTNIFGDGAGPLAPNRLVLRLQPDEGVHLLIEIKEPGPGGLRIREAPLKLSYADTFTLRYPDAYERLLMDVVRGNLALFMRKDEIEAAWAWTDAITAAWAADKTPLYLYAAGEPGPSEADALLGRDDRAWFDLELKDARA